MHRMNSWLFGISKEYQNILNIKHYKFLKIRYKMLCLTAAWKHCNYKEMMVNLQSETMPLL